MYYKIKIFSLSVFLGLNACFSENKAPSQVHQAVEISQQGFAGNVSNSLKGASISIILDFNSFSTKANASGVVPKQPSDVATVKLYLTTSNTDPLNSSDLLFTSNTLTFSGVSQTYTFGNVLPGGPYFVAAELFDAGSVNIVQPVVFGGTTGTRGLTVSGIPVPSVTVNANAVTSHHNSLTISPVLKNATGAVIETTISPNNGIFTGPVTASFTLLRLE